MRYGRSPDALTQTSAVADTRSYSLCKLESPSLHFTTLTGLVPNSEYYYAITAPQCAASSPLNFTSPRIVGDKATAYPLRVMGYGDMGITHSQVTADFVTARVAAGSGPDVVLHAGDISYSDNRGCPTYDLVQVRGGFCRAGTWGGIAERGHVAERGA